jgi:hypothetical protein
VKERCVLRNNTAHKSVTFYVPGIAACRVELLGPGEAYFSRVETWIGYRRRGYCTSLLIFAVDYLGFFPELHIRNQSIVMKHIATDLGYGRVGVSERFRCCSKWTHTGAAQTTVSIHIGHLLSDRLFCSSKGCSLLLYVTMQSNHRPKATT